MEKFCPVLMTQIYCLKLKSWTDLINEEIKNEWLNTKAGNC